MHGSEATLLETSGMFAKLRVWGGCENNHRRIVAATSKMRAIALLDISHERFIEWFDETGNHVELSIATSEGVWEARTLDGRVRNAADFKRWLPPKLMKANFAPKDGFPCTVTEN
jgi:hypothetical protein